MGLARPGPIGGLGGWGRGFRGGSRGLRLAGGGGTRAGGHMRVCCVWGRLPRRGADMLRCGKTHSCASTCSCSCSCRCKPLVHANTHAHIHIHTRTSTCTCNAHAHTCDVRVLILMTEFEHVVPYAAPRRQEPSTAQCMSATPPSPSRSADGSFRRGDALLVEACLGTLDHPATCFSQRTPVCNYSARCLSTWRDAVPLGPKSFRPSRAQVIPMSHGALALRSLISNPPPASKGVKSALCSALVLSCPCSSWCCSTAAVG